MKKSTENLFDTLSPWRDLIEDFTPFGETPEEVWEDDTNVMINAPRALMAVEFQSRMGLMQELQEQGLLLRPQSGSYKIEFGTPILICNRLHRKEKSISAQRGVKKYWEAEEFEDPQQGIYLGQRTLSNGIRYHDMTYTQTEHLTVHFVAVGPNENPFYATKIRTWHE